MSEGNPDARQLLDDHYGDHHYGPHETYDVTAGPLLCRFMESPSAGWWCYRIEFRGKHLSEGEFSTIQEAVESADEQMESILNEGLEVINGA